MDLSPSYPPLVADVFAKSPLAQRASLAMLLARPSPFSSWPISLIVRRQSDDYKSLSRDSQGDRAIPGPNPHFPQHCSPFFLFGLKRLKILSSYPFPYCPSLGKYYFFNSEEIKAPAGSLLTSKTATCKGTPAFLSSERFAAVYRSFVAENT